MMSPLEQQFAFYGVCTLIGAVGTLWLAHMLHRIHVAENYVKKPALDGLSEKIDKMQESISEILKAVWEMKGQNGNSK